jgi:hypothetical protein
MSIYIPISIAFAFGSILVFASLQASKEMSNHRTYNECVRLNAVGASVGVQLESMPKAKQLCRELYPDNINNKN